MEALELVVYALVVGLVTSLFSFFFFIKLDVGHIFYILVWHRRKGDRIVNHHCQDPGTLPVSAWLCAPTNPAATIHSWEGSEGSCPCHHTVQKRGESAWKEVGSEWIPWTLHVTSPGWRPWLEGKTMTPADNEASQVCFCSHSAVLSKGGLGTVQQEKCHGLGSGKRSLVS